MNECSETNWFAFHLIVEVKENYIVKSHANDSNDGFNRIPLK